MSWKETKIEKEDEVMQKRKKTEAKKVCEKERR